MKEVGWSEGPCEQRLVTAFPAVIEVYQSNSGYKSIRVGLPVAYLKTKFALPFTKGYLCANVRSIKAHENGINWLNRKTFKKTIFTL